ncbi:MAG TPA: site-specific DNA-methyltransferase [Candidatus Lokiarchaeia archaeon]|nr:site-specific DNA-methyltransferase [Candidatus Lokiarchaeia archaeon]
MADEFSEDASIIVHLGDTLDFLRTIPDNSIRLVITSPPYNIGKEYETQKELEAYLAFQKEVIGELVRVLANDGSICWETGNYVDGGEIVPLDIVFYPVFKSFGLQLRNRIIWHFNHGLHCSKRFSGRYESILWFTKSDEYLFRLDDVRVPAKYPGKRAYRGPNKGKPSGNPLGKNPSDTWEFVASEWDNEIWEIPNVKSNHPEKTVHPCQFPIELCERCVLAHTNPGDWVLDPFMGAGSSLLAAIMHERKAIGVDKEPAYVDLARTRITDFFNGTLKYRPMGKPIHAPTGREKVSKIPDEWRDPKDKGFKGNDLNRNTHGTTL